MLWLEATAGAGKSSFVSALTLLEPDAIGEAAKAARETVLAHHMCSAKAGLSHTLSGEGFVANLVKTLAHRLPGFARVVRQSPSAEEKLKARGANSADALFAGILQPLAKLERSERRAVVVVVDSLDEAALHQGAGDSVVDVLHAAWRWRGEWPKWLRLVVTCR